MTEDRALRMLEKLGFRGREVSLAELIPVVEMAWADGEIHPNERALLEAWAEALVERLNEEAGVVWFSVTRARELLDQLTKRRLHPAERSLALTALRTWAGARRERMVEWAEAVAAVHGSPVWDVRERFWLRAMKQNFGVRGDRTRV